MSQLRNFKHDFKKHCETHASSRAIMDTKTERVVTYQTLYTAVEGFAQQLTNEGVKAGHRTFSILPNSIEQFVALLATWWVGADFCPISPLATPQEAARFARHCQSFIGLVPEKLNPDLKAQLTQEMATKKVLTFSLDGDVSRFSDQGPLTASVPDNAGRLILFTSGTVSDPKAIVIQGDKLWSSAVAWTEVHTFLNPASRFYNVLPMSYLGGLFNLGLIPLACGGSFVLADAFSGITALKFWKEVQAHGVNTLWLAPTMLRTLLSLYKPDKKADAIYKQIGTSFVGMAPITLEEKEKFEKTFGISLLENFALSETTFLSTEREGQSLPRSQGSSGQALPWVEIQFDEASEIRVKTPFLYEGLLDTHGQIQPPTVINGFFRTGDLGTFDDGGTLVIKGRSRDIVKKGGYLIFLRELEEVAQGVSNVMEAATVGVPHDFYGETPVVFVQLKDKKEPKASLEDLKSYFTKTCAKYKWPSEIVAIEAFPKTESGKVKKRVLVDQLKDRSKIKESVTLK